MRGIATIHEETSAVAREGDDVVPCSGNQSHLVSELRHGRSCLSECRAGQAQHRCAAREDLEEFTTLRIHYD